MEQEGFVVGVDLGTSNITGLLGRRNEQGVISILASESIPSDSCIKHGIIYNIDEATGKIRKLISLLENKAGKKIGKVYVSVAGMSLRTVEHIQTKNFGTETTVTFAMLEQLEQQARLHKLPLLSTYSVVSPETSLDGQPENDPIEKTASVIEARYRLIVGRPNIKANIARCFTDKNHIGIASYIIGPVATGAVLLGEEEKNAGCVLIDFGGGTTTLSVYKDGLLRYLRVIPFGGRTITRDIQALGFTEEQAETYKIRYGRVGKNKNRTATPQTPPDKNIDLRELNKVIQLRQEEIIVNLINQIEESGYTGQLNAGIFITGGASQMNGLPEFLAEKTRLTVQPGSIKRLYINNATELLKNPSFSACLGLMLFAKENCEKMEQLRYERKPQYEYQQHQPRPAQTEEKEIKAETVNDTEKEENTEETLKSKKEGKKHPSLFDFFGKIQNIGGAMFKDEE